MKPRKPGLTFQDALPHWCPSTEFAQITNAGSLSLPFVETYLNRVMLRAKEMLTGEKYSELRGDIDLFVKQESNHYRQHRLFNQKIEEAGYDAVKPIGDRLQADYDEFLKTKSLRFNAAYCEGFESLGIIQAEFFFTQIDDLLAGADPRVVALWKWHLAEEYEHRSVCFDVHKAISRPFSYASRLGGFFLAVRHLSKFGKDVSDALLACDRVRMTEGQRATSISSEKTYRKRFGRFALPRLLNVLSPFYNPIRYRAPRGAAAFLLQYE
ncbi:MAG: metal-dependent hydrolase [Rhodospirillales bacterium]|nr:metal-dependent hydrolase [Rhodospirillales bacterium]